MRKRLFVRKPYAQAGKLTVVNRMRLRRQNALRITLRDGGGQGLMGNGDVLGNIRKHINTLMNVFIEQVCAQL